MKRMSEVFHGEPCGFSVRMTDEQVRYGQHAINHVDALADALAALLDAVINRSAHDSINNQIISAARALGCYRGDK